MLVSVAWLRELCPVDEPAARIAARLTARGLTVDAVREGGVDAVLDVDVPANRPDCLGHLGLARELSAACGVPMAARPAPASEPTENLARVEIEAPELCARYAARIVSGVRVAPSPEWVVARLAACGLHAVNNVVDATNLVLLELGHPVHAFDLARLAESTIRVRRARAGETLTTLDGIERRLLPEDLVIADARRPVALAGILGGAETAVADTTTDVLIESAWFLPRAVRATARRLAIATDASHRFERGVDPEGALVGQDLAARLLATLAGGSPRPGVIDAHPAPRAPRRLSLRPERVGLLLGFDPGVGEMIGALGALGLRPERAASGTIEVTVPGFRVDLEREADLVEEVARHVGYDRVPAQLPAGPGAPAAPQPELEREERCRDALAGLGFEECFTYSMLPEAEDDPFVLPGAPEALAVTNPISETMTRLRRSLIPGLLRALDGNRRRGIRDVRLFEVGRVFLGRAPGGLAREPLRAGFAWAGAARPRHWSERPRDVSLVDAAGVLEHLIDALRRGDPLARRRGAPAGLHPNRSLLWSARDEPPAAWCGALHPDRARALGFDDEVFVAEIDLGSLAREGALARFVPVPRVPSVSRDLSLVLREGVRYDDVLEVLREVPAPAPVVFEAIDRYVGPPLEPGESSLTVRAMLQPLETTLTDPQIEAFREGLVEAVGRQLGVRLRDGR